MVLQNSGRYKSEHPKKFGSGGELETTQSQIQRIQNDDLVDKKYGFERLCEIGEKTGFLINMRVATIINSEGALISAMDYYFIEEDGTRFKVSLPFQPYFLVLADRDKLEGVGTYLTKRFVGQIASVEKIVKEDLDLPNHLVGLKQRYLKLNFLTSGDMIKVRKDLQRIVAVNRERDKHDTYYMSMLTSSLQQSGSVSASASRSEQQGSGGSNLDAPGSRNLGEYLDYIRDIREFDVAYSVRVAIDTGISVGRWYLVKCQGSVLPPVITHRKDLIEWPEPIVFAYDIETTKLPLRFPDSNSDQIMMISYMIDGQGHLITNREIVSSDVQDFEYSPRPDLEGFFSVWNAPNEKALLERFFAHIIEVRPHVFVTYNGDFFDWPFVEARAKFHDMDMAQEIGFLKGQDNVYACRAASHMDCLSWVKRDSYLPMGSQGLKAVAKAKLRYDPVELDPEDMCPMAINNPQVLANYSVSDAVATYYLYMKYVHPFIFALCTIIPRDPDEVLRKGSGTLCESLLMVEAFRANVVFPNRQQEQLGKLTSDGRLLDSETYVGGHVEALESGVFRSDIPCRFRLEPDMLQTLMDGVQGALEHSLVEEEGLALSEVTNLEEVHTEICRQLQELRDRPNRIENPVIYHLDVAAMYPNIILTNRLQPSAMVDELACAACDFNRPGADCQRSMVWTWRGEHLPASLSELQRIRAQLETERFPPKFPGGKPRALHQLDPVERAALEKKRLSEYCRTAYKKTKVTRVEERSTTVCQRENSFYVDTVRAFRDRRYEYKGLTKVAKKQVSQAVASGDIAEIKSARNREVLYDSLQLAHKCILNSFYGYVMRRGARWYSMEMAGIVCHTGANIIRQAREIIEQVGRPLELDTDGIWCVLPASFPENFEVTTTNPKKSKVVVSYPNAVLNLMVKENYTNHQYQELKDPETLKYERRSENSIFFEVDGPYRAMVLPASKEEGKRLKKRYAVFNEDGSLAELKGFEVKRRGELRLIKVFQGSVFEAFLKGETLEECYSHVAKVADYWLDVLYTKASNLSESELLDLVSENRSMSKKLEEYGTQKSTSISTAKRLAEFLGDQMVKDAGLSCRFIVSRQPEGSPVTERAVPVAIFQAEESVRRHYLCRWLKDSTVENLDIRSVLDWNYYIERLGGTIQKIVTIPAAMQGVANPVPRVRHPDWLHRRLNEKGDARKQRRIDVMFQKLPRPVPQNEDDTPEQDVDEPAVMDVEDIGQQNLRPAPVSSKRKRDQGRIMPQTTVDSQDWRTELGPPPSRDDLDAWLVYHKKKWALQSAERKRLNRQSGGNEVARRNVPAQGGTTNTNRVRGTLGNFLRRAQRTLLNSPWQVVQLASTSEPGVFRIWALLGAELHKIRLVVPRVFYVNQHEAMPDDRLEEENVLWRNVNRTLPRGRPAQNLYRYSVPEDQYQEHADNLIGSLATPNVEGVYETQVSLEFRALLQLGCICGVSKGYQEFGDNENNTFSLDQLQARGLEAGQGVYLPEGALHSLCLCVMKAPAPSPRALLALMMPPAKKSIFVIVDSVRSIQMPNIQALYTAERNARLNQGRDKNLPPPELLTEIKSETDIKTGFRLLQRALQAYKDEKRGPTLVTLQSNIDSSDVMNLMPGLAEFPVVPLESQSDDSENTLKTEASEILSRLEWQRLGSRAFLKRYLDMPRALDISKRQCQYLHVPLGNLPPVIGDAFLFGSDLMFARHLLKNNFILWCSATDTPDLGGREADDYTLVSDAEQGCSVTVNNPGCYTNVCVELTVDALAVDALLQSERINTVEGTASSVAFDRAQPVSVSTLAGASQAVGPIISNTASETAICSGAFRVMKSMVASWLRDVGLHQNMFADLQISYFYRWLCSPHTLLYDPALRQGLQLLMKKLFLQLVAEFKRMGAVVVYANLSRIIVSTRKNSVEDAVNYLDFITTSIKNKELFHSIGLECTNCWQYLLWLGPSNYAGVKGTIVPPGDTTSNLFVARTPSQKSGETRSKSPTGEGDEDNLEDDREEEDLDSEEENEDEPEIVMEWSLSLCLPHEASCRENFNALVAGYLNSTYQHLQAAHEEKLGKEETPVRKRTLSQIAPLGSVQQSTADFAKSLITGELGQKLYQIVDRLNRKLPSHLGRQRPSSQSLLQRSKNASSSLDQSDFGNDLIGGGSQPALEFTKAICKVLELDNNVREEVGALRRNMLRLIGVSEFSDQAEWQDPCKSVVLPEVLCPSCNYCHELDLVKQCHWDTLEDPGDGTPAWTCPKCHIGYEQDVIEFLVLESFNRRTMAYNLQDLQCSRCKQIKMENMTLRCDCAATYRTILDPKEMQQLMSTMSHLAEKLSMHVLSETIEWAASVGF